MSDLEMLTKLKMFANSRVRLFFKDGEILVCNLTIVLEDENLIIFDLVSSNRADKYERSDKRPHISTPISEVSDCERVSESQAQ